MDFSTARTEFFARGFDSLNDGGTGLARAKRWLNQSYLGIVALHPWPWSEKTTSGTAPLTISDLDEVLYVVDTTNDRELHGVDQRDIRNRDPDITATGNPDLFYFEGNVMKVWPPNTTPSISVRHQYAPAELSADGDTPILPAQWHDTWINGAVIKAYRNSDNLDAALALTADYEADIQAMVSMYLSRNSANDSFVQDSLHSPV